MSTSPQPPIESLLAAVASAVEAPTVVKIKDSVKAMIEKAKAKMDKDIKEDKSEKKKKKKSKVETPEKKSKKDAKRAELKAKLLAITNVEEIREREDAIDQFNWLISRKFDDIDLLMSLHKSTRAAWRQVKFFHKSREHKMRRDKLTLMSARLRAIGAWASRSNVESWKSDSRVNQDLLKEALTYQTAKTGGQGVSKLQNGLWHLKYPNAFREEDRAKSLAAVTKVTKAAKSDKRKISSKGTDDDDDDDKSKVKRQRKETTGADASTAIEIA
jgi:hypothetical protein